MTIAALHGAGGSVIGPRVAERLGVTFLDRAIPAAVARRAGLTEEAVDAVDARSQDRGDRFRSALARTSTAVNPAADVERIDLEEARIRSEIESFLASASESGGVVLGRAGGLVVAEGEGFEPSRRVTPPAGFQDRCIQPLCHPSGALRSQCL